MSESEKKGEFLDVYSTPKDDAEKTGYVIAVGRHNIKTDQFGIFMMNFRAGTECDALIGREAMANLRDALNRELAS